VEQREESAAAGQPAPGLDPGDRTDVTGFTPVTAAETEGDRLPAFPIADGTNIPDSRAPEYPPPTHRELLRKRDGWPMCASAAVLEARASHRERPFPAHPAGTAASSRR
jgi:hypothetical protein